MKAFIFEIDEIHDWIYGEEFIFNPTKASTNLISLKTPCVLYSVNLWFAILVRWFPFVRTKPAPLCWPTAHSAAVETFS